MMIVISSSPKYQVGRDGWQADDTKSANHVKRFRISDLSIRTVGDEREKKPKAKVKLRDIKGKLPGQLHAEAIIESSVLIPVCWKGRNIIFPGTRLFRADCEEWRYIYIRFNPEISRWVFGSVRSDQRLLPHFCVVTFKPQTRD